MEQFVPNLRGLNGDEDFPEAMLVGIYKSIEEHELKVFFFSPLRSLESLTHIKCSCWKTTRAER